MDKVKTKKTPLLNLLFAIILIEIVVGGSGRLLDIGPVSLKMILFLLGMIVFAFNIKNLKNSIVVQIQLVYTVSIMFSFSIGLFFNADVNLIIEDIKPLLFFFLMSYFYVSIKTIKDVHKVIYYIKYGSLFMSIIHLLIVFLIFIKFINFDRFYAVQSEGSEIMFRNENLFFYKGFLYLCIGFFFLLLSDKKKDKILSLIVLVSICLTLTRGFIFFTFIVLGFYLLFINKVLKLKFLTILLGILGILYALPILIEARSENSSDSDVMRKITFEQVVDRTDFFSFFFGHGFGHGVPIRPIHMENSFLEIVYKQGIIGLAIYIYILFILVLLYKKIKNKKTVLPFVLATFFVYLQSFTNPYVNNPIGLSIVCLSLVVLYRIYYLEKNDYALKKINSYD